MQVVSWVYRDGTVYWPRVLLVGLLAAVAISIGTVAFTSSAVFGPFNPTWDGTSDIRGELADGSDAEVNVITDAGDYGESEPTETVVFVLAPVEEYGSADARHVRQFVANGGTLVVMENFESAGNDLLESVGASARVDGRLVRDEQNHDVAPTMPIATNVTATNHSLTEGVDQLTLNYASAVEPNNATVLIRTSEFAYLTENEDRTLENDTDLVSTPVAAVEDVENGTVVVVSDPSIAINVMLDRPDNEQFVQQLATQEETVLFDLSHTETLPPLTRMVLAIRGSPPLQILLGLFAVGLCAIGAEYGLRYGLERTGAKLALGGPVLGDYIPQHVPGMSRVGRQRADRPLSTMSDAELASYLRHNHPDWEEERIRRVIAGFNPNRPEREAEHGHE